MDPFPVIERWRLPRSACERTRDTVIPAGLRGNESGVFWIGQRSAVSSISAVVFPSGPGVIETPGRWSVGAEVYAAAAVWAKPRRLSLLAVIHTHLSGIPPRMSYTDQTRGLRVQGALAIIIGGGGQESDLDAWGWYVYDGDGYRELGERERRERVELIDADIEFATIAAPIARDSP
jgi:hypothetical protein